MTKGKGPTQFIIICVHGLEAACLGTRLPLARPYSDEDGLDTLASGRRKAGMCRRINKIASSPLYQGFSLRSVQYRGKSEVEGMPGYHLTEEEYRDYNEGRGPAWEEEQRRKSEQEKKRREGLED